MLAAISLLAFTSAVVSADQCCEQRRVNSVDERGGVYSLDVNLTMIANTSSAPFCSNSCIYTKKGKPGQFFCFGHGSLTSECSITPSDTTGILLIGKGINNVQSYGCNISLSTDLGDFGSGGGATVYNGKPYIYNPTRKWCYYGSLEPLATWNITDNCISREKREYSSWTTLGNFIMVTGGHNGSRAIDKIVRYDGNTWTPLVNKLTSPREAHCSVAISKTEMIVIGGFNGTTFLTTVEKYDSDGLIIKTLQSMAIGRKGPGCTIYNNELYVAGGIGAGGLLADVEVYNIETDQWKPINKMNNARELPAFFVQNNRLTVLGGYGAVRSIEYLEKNGMWEKSPDPLEKDFEIGVSVKVKCPA